MYVHVLYNTYPYIVLFKLNDNGKYIRIPKPEVSIPVSVPSPDPGNAPPANSTKQKADPNFWNRQLFPTFGESQGCAGFHIRAI